MNDLVSICVISYNRYETLKKCIDTFFKTLDYDNIELIITDNGSTDEQTLDYLNELEVPCNYDLIRNEVNDYPNCIWKAKNQARESAKGEYFIDCPDDHMFVVKDSWIPRCIEHIDADPTVGCVIHFAYPEYRFHKPNNLMIPHSRDGYFFESLLKGYADYNIMSREKFNLLGPFKHELGHATEGDFIARSTEMGWHRNMIKFPVAIINEDCHTLVSPVSREEIEGKYGELKRPVSNEQLISLAYDLDKMI